MDGDAHGIYHLENLDLSQLAADKVYEFAFIYIPLPLKGATGSPAVRLRLNRDVSKSSINNMALGKNKVVSGAHLRIG